MQLDGYVRVSQVGGRSGERFISPSVQRDQIEAWIGANRAGLGEVFEELDESGARADRPLLLRALRRIESGESEGLVVAKLDRFGRSLIDGLAAISRIEAAGGTFVSVQDGLDLGTPTGKLVLRIMFSMAEWELDRVRANWDAARAKAIARGAYPSPYPPLGYRRDDEGRLQVDPRARGLIATVFRRRGEGISVADLASFLNDSPLPNPTGLPFAGPSILKLLRNRAYLGEARSGPYMNPDAHEPLVDAATWQQAQLTPIHPHHAIDALLIGLIRCAHCGRGMVGYRASSRALPSLVYRCLAGAGCSEPAAARADELEPLVEDLILHAAGTALARPSHGALAKCESAAEAAQHDLVLYRDNPRLLRTLGAVSFERGLASRQQQVERALLSLASARRRLEPRLAGLADLPERWSGLDLSERKAACADLLECVAVERGNEPMVERAWVSQRARGALVPRPEEAEPFDPRASGARRLRTPPRWSEARIERELVDFLDSGEDWPGYGDFERSGRARLHAQMMGWGGPYYWAPRLGREIGPGAVVWNPSRVGDALRPFLRGRTSWPRRGEFEGAGLMSLYLGVQHHGGIAHWAEEFGLDHADRRRQWSKARIERELGEFVAGRETFPTHPEFRAAGLESLCSALRGHGGQLYWAKRFGLKAPRRGGEKRSS